MKDKNQKTTRQENPQEKEKTNCCYSGCKGCTTYKKREIDPSIPIELQLNEQGSEEAISEEYLKYLD